MCLKSPSSPDTRRRLCLSLCLSVHAALQLSRLPAENLSRACPWPPTVDALRASVARPSTMRFQSARLRPLRDVRWRCPESLSTCSLVAVFCLPYQASVQAFLCTTFAAPRVSDSGGLQSTSGFCQIHWQNIKKKENE